MKAGNQQTGARLRVVLAQDVAIGPGKADLLEGVGETGSIAAAGRRLGEGGGGRAGPLGQTDAPLGPPPPPP